MKPKYKFNLFLTIMISFFIYTKIIHPYLQEVKIKTELKDRWNITMDSEDKLIIGVKNKPGWHSDQQKFTSFESANQYKLSKHIDNKNSDFNKMDFNIIKRIIEIEDILDIDKKDRINFASDYHYKGYTDKKFTPASEQKNDLLYHITIKENDKLKMFFIEDLNVLDLERSRF